MLPLVVALAALAQAAPRNPDVYWTGYIYPETLEGEARARAADADIVHRDGVRLAIAYHGQTVKTLSSPATNCVGGPGPCDFWLYAGSITLDGEKLAVVRMETGKGGSFAIVKPDGSLFRTGGWQQPSPDNRWIASGGDWFDQMDDSPANGYLRIYSWKTTTPPAVFHKSCAAEGWADATHLKVYCNDDETDVVYEASLMRDAGY